MQQISKQNMGRNHGASSRSLRLAGLVKGLRGTLFLALLLHSTKAFSMALPAAHSVTLMWDSNPSADEITGYRVYSGTASGSYSESIAVGNETTGTVTGLADGVTYFFAVTATGLNGLESGFSAEVSYAPAIPRMLTRVTPGGQMVLTVQGPVGHTYLIEASEDLMAWTVIGTVFLEAGVAVDFSDPDAASFSKRFYRLRDISL